MNGNTSGIGWYINWQKQVMMYDGLIIIAVMCSLTLTLLFKMRDKPTTGQALIDGKKITKAGSDRGFAFQGSNLFPRLMVSSNHLT